MPSVHPYEKRVSQHAGNLLLLEVDQVLVVLEDLDVCEAAPGVLNLLSGELVLRFLSDLATLFLEAAPGPLDLDGSDVVHGEPVVFEKSTSQRHLVGGLDESGTEVFHGLILAL